MQQDEWCDANVILDNFGFREPRLRIERLGEICAVDLLPFDLECDLIRRVGGLPAYALVPRHTSIFSNELREDAGETGRSSTLHKGQRVAALIFGAIV